MANNVGTISLLGEENAKEAEMMDKMLGIDKNLMSHNLLTAYTDQLSKDVLETLGTTNTRSVTTALQPDPNAWMGTAKVATVGDAGLDALWGPNAKKVSFNDVAPETLSREGAVVTTAPELRKSGSGSESKATSGAEGMSGSWGQSKSGELDDETGSQSDEPRSGSKPKRTQAQQLQNKLAQQRYRERRKHKISEMETTIVELNRKLENMMILKRQNDVLVEQAAMLKTQLAQREMEIKQSNALLGQRETELKNARAQAEAQPAPCLQSDGKPKEAPEELRQNFISSVQKIQDFLLREDVAKLELTGINAPTEVLAEAVQLVSNSCMTCAKAMSMESPQVLQLLVQDVNSLGGTTWAESASTHWLAVMRKLQLTPGQKSTLLRLRREQLQRLAVVYTRRQLLNQHAIEYLKRTVNGGPLDITAPDDPQAKLLTVARTGFLSSLGSTLECNSVLDSLKANLIQEQNHVTQMNFVTMHKVLSPLQAATAFVSTYPSHCDSLALANAIARDMNVGLMDEVPEIQDAFSISTAASLMQAPPNPVAHTNLAPLEGVVNVGSALGPAVEAGFGL